MNTARKVEEEVMTRSLRDIYDGLRYEWSASTSGDFTEQARLLPMHKAQQLVYFNPNRVRRCLNNRSVRSRRFCLERQWHPDDILEIEQARGPIVETVHLMFTEGKPYTQTPQYKVMLSAVRAGGSSAKELGGYWCRTPEDVTLYFESLIAAYRKISVEGYKTQTQLSKEEPQLVRKRGDEIKLYVDYSGELILGGGGTHRLCIAKNLGLSKIPGLVRGVDLRWAAEIYKGSGLKRLDHSLSEALESYDWA